MSQLKGWLYFGGGFFVLLVLVSLPPIPANSFVSTLVDPLGQRAPLLFGFPIDPGILFGLELGLIGLMLIVACRAPYRAIGLIYPIIAIEVVRNILISFEKIGPDNSLGFYNVFIIIHLLILALGTALLQQGLVRTKRIAGV
jgi:hypothetical protein